MKLCNDHIDKVFDLEDASDSKYDHVGKISYCDLQNDFSTLHNESKEAFKRLPQIRKFSAI